MKRVAESSNVEINPFDQRVTLSFSSDARLLADTEEYLDEVRKMLLFEDVSFLDRFGEKKATERGLIHLVQAMETAVWAEKRLIKFSTEARDKEATISALVSENKAAKRILKERDKKLGDLRKALQENEQYEAKLKEEIEEGKEIREVKKREKKLKDSLEMESLRSPRSTCL